MKALLVVGGDAYMRNDIAHGLIDDAGAWSYNSFTCGGSACGSSCSRSSR